MKIYKIKLMNMIGGYSILISAILAKIIIPDFNNFFVILMGVMGTVAIIEGIRIEEKKDDKGVDYAR